MKVDPGSVSGRYSCLHGSIRIGYAHLHEQTNKDVGEERIIGSLK